MRKPKENVKVLLLENIHPLSAKLFKQAGYDVRRLSKSLPEEELCHAIKDIHILGIRSKTEVSKKVLRAGKSLLAVGAFCIGTNQIDLSACADQGVIVFNAPYSNTRSVVEFAIAEIIMLMRHILVKNNCAHEGIWKKTASHSHEIRGKSLGIVGYGNIGSQLSILAEALGMHVYYYDVVEKLALGNAKKCRSLSELLKNVDVVSLHVDGQPQNNHLIGKKELAQMKKGSYLLNLSRGQVVNIEALAAALQAGHIAGAAVDVFPEEPKSNAEPFSSLLRGLDNVILTPHVGGSTEEAQRNIAEFVPVNITNYMSTGSSHMSVNFPQLQLSEFQNSHRLIHIHENKPGVLAGLNKLLAKHKINIVGQHLKTNDNIGYVITDIDGQYGHGVLQEMRKVPNTIKFRVLY